MTDSVTNVARLARQMMDVADKALADQLRSAPPATAGNPVPYGALSLLDRDPWAVLRSRRWDDIRGHDAMEINPAPDFSFPDRNSVPPASLPPDKAMRKDWEEQGLREQENI